MSTPPRILEVVDELPKKTGNGGRRPNADLVALLDQLPPWPKWAIVLTSTDLSERNRFRKRLDHFADRVEYATRGDAVYVRRLQTATTDPAPRSLEPDTPARPKVIGWIGMPATKRMDLFVDAWRAHNGDIAKVAAELDCSQSIADQWRRNARTHGRIR